MHTSNMASLRYLHTMIRVTNLEKSLHFYGEGLGFRQRSRQDHEKDRFTLVFLAQPGDAAAIELTWNWDTHAYTRGDGYGHVAFAVDSIADVQRRLQEHGYDLSWGPGKTPSGKRAMAFVDDPDGYEIELLEGDEA
jgi:lactoylglutathione lyase